MIYVFYDIYKIVIQIGVTRPRLKSVFKSNKFRRNIILGYLCESGQLDRELSIRSDSLHTQRSKIDTTSQTCAEVRSHDKVKGEGSTE